MAEHVPERAEVRALVARLAAAGLDAVWVDRAPVFDKTTLLHALYQAVPLTADFGFNWDALEDALYGPEDPGAPPRVLVFRDLELLEEQEPETARVFLDIVDTVAASPESTLLGLVRAGDRASRSRFLQEVE
jgi:RNAse (barnase) inhibitor barstar